MNKRTGSNALVAGLLALAVWGGIAGAVPTVTPPAAAGYSAPSLFNLANAYARAGKPGLAVLNYERARLLAPNDPDIRANLRYVRNTSGIAPVAENGWTSDVTLAGPNTFFWLGCAGLLLTGFGVSLVRLVPAGRRTFRAATIAGMTCIAVSVCNAAAIWPIMNEAVVVANSTPARIAPVTSGEAAFTLPEADVVSINGQRGDFVLVRTSAGRMGWVPKADIASVIPKA